ncbi:MAG: TetR/AcrR family transcriptional regulator [Actinomycetota bacterium]
MPEKKTARKEEKPADDLSTRDRIQESALEVFAEKGLCGATMVEIARRAGLTGGALYRYYPGKDELFQAVIDRHSGAFSALEMVRDLIPELQPLTALKFIAQGMFLFFYGNIDFMRVVVSEAVRSPELSRAFFDKMLQPSEEFIRGCIQQWKEQGLLRDDLDPAAATTAFMGMLGYLMLDLAFFSGGTQREVESGELAEQFTRVFLEGVLKR